jgi:E3 ubiquitin-protein ligase HUWE1
MALSIARVLVMLTRRREIALLVAEKKNLQRLFLMVKQLGNGVSSRFLSSFMLVLRHIVEDEETLKQIFKSEILTAFTGRNVTRNLDLGSYTRDLSHLVVRDPALFVEMSNEMLKLAAWQLSSPGSPLVLKSASEDQITPQRESPPDEAADKAATSVEDNDSQNDDVKAKAPEVKHPFVENPDGVIQFLLSELIVYKDVEDRDVPVTEKADPEDSSSITDPPVAPTTAPFEPFTAEEWTPSTTDTTKNERPRFKPDDHPIFIYRCFLLQCLVELLHSYNRTKIEFINYSRKADPMVTTPSKPRSGILNYLLNGLVASGYVDKDENSIHCKKRLAVSDWAIKVLVALCAKTGEKNKSAPLQRYSILQVDDKDDEPELTFVRRFVLEHAIKVFKDASSTTDSLQNRYSKLLCLSDMFNRLLSKPSTNDGAAGANNNSYKILGRMMFEKNLVSVLTASLAEIDLSQPGAKRVIKFILRPLQELTTLATHLSLTQPETINSVLGNTEDDVISSASSVSEIEDDREETPDLYRNSALGLLDPNRNEESDSDSDEQDEDEEMYDEEDYGDEMDYDDGMPAAPEDDEAISDEDEDADGLEGPIEGMPGDVPMELEFVVNEGGMDIDSDGDDSESDDDSEEDTTSDEDEDGQDFDIEGAEGEITGDNDGDSLNDGENEGDWEDEEDADLDDEDDENGEDIDVDVEGDFADGGPDDTPALQDDLNNLLRVLNGHDEEMTRLVQGRGLVAEAEDGEDDGQEDPEAVDDDEDEDMDENDVLGHDQFDDFMDGDIEDDYYDDQWALDAEPAPRSNRGFARRHFGARDRDRDRAFARQGFMPPPTFRPGEPLPSIYRFSARNRGPRVDNEDGTNPLLQRPAGETAQNSQGREFSRFNFNPAAHIGRSDDREAEHGLGRHSGLDPGDWTRAIDYIAGEGTSGHGRLLDLIMQRGGSRSLMMSMQGHPQISININSPMGDIPIASFGPQRLGRFAMGADGHMLHRMREDPPRAVNFAPATTMTRWSEEKSILFGNQYLSKIQRVQIWLMSLLAPVAQQEEKERRQKREEERRARAEEEEKQRLEAERLLKEQEEKRAAERAEEERQRAAAEAEAAAAAAREETTEAVAPADTTEQMEDVQQGESPAPDAEPSTDGAGASAQERIFTTIRGRQLDITGLAIDREYLEALPEELREEVIMQQYATRREEAQQQNASTSGGGPADGAAAGIDPEYLNDFLNALPEEVREEIRQSEANAQRQRERDNARRQAAAAAGRPAIVEDMNNDDFFATLDPALRREILSEQPDGILSQLNPRHAAEARDRRIHHYSGMTVGRANEIVRNDRDGQRDTKRQVIQLVDKAGVATLLRLMFLPQQGSLRSNLWHILKNVCGNRQTRFEVINMLLVILREGSTDVTAVERSLASLSLRARASAPQKTPQPLKRTLSLQPNAGLGEDITPLVVVQQCLSALKALSQHGMHVRTLFLREVDISSSAKTKKGKDKESKVTKYPINDLIALLDRKVIVDSGTSLQALAELLAAVTSPLAALMRSQKEQKALGEEKQDSVSAEQPTVEGTERTDDASNQDTAMTDAPAAAENAAETSQASQAADVNKEENKSAEEPRAKRTFEPPVIPTNNLQLLVSIFVAPECGNDTFHATLETMSSISTIPGTSEVFGKQLINHVKNLSQSLCASLDDFLPQLAEAQSTTDLHGITSSRFSHSGSDQVKLLHVLKALDYVSEPPVDSKKDGETEQASKKSILTSSYEGLSLGPLWLKLSECLGVMGKKDNVIAFASILLPLIESLMVVCKNTSLKEQPLIQQVQEEEPPTPTISDPNDLEQLFFNFTTEHRKILNDIIRQSPKLMQGNGSFSLLVKNPKVLDFDNKRAFFTKQIHSRLHQQRHPQPPLQLNVRREQVFQDSYKALYFKSAEEMKHGKLNIRFNGEEGVDAGGVTREWFQVLARGIFNPDWALWQPVASDKTTFHPNSLSWINGEHLVYFKFIGRIIGKALHEGRVLDCHFSRAVYKRMLGKQPNLKDLESMDLDYYKSLVWILENDITDILTEDFSVIEEQFGEEKVVDLVENGRNVPVTEDNKRDYVQKLVEYRLTGSVSEQLDHFIRGFHDIIPAELVAIFDEQELELLISGLPEIDVDDWKANTDYHNYNANSPQITWFWRIVRTMSNEERAKLLQFITGTSKVPLNGFKDLEGMQGTTRFSSKFCSPFLQC